MEIANYQEALDASTAHRDLIVTPVTAGLINQTYKVIIRSSGYKFLLQQINRDVFPNRKKYRIITKKYGPTYITKDQRRELPILLWSPSHSISWMKQNYSATGIKGIGAGLSSWTEHKHLIRQQPLCKQEQLRGYLLEPSHPVLNFSI